MSSHFFWHVPVGVRYRPKADVRPAAGVAAELQRYGNLCAIMDAATQPKARGPYKKATV